MAVKCTSPLPCPRLAWIWYRHIIRTWAFQRCLSIDWAMREASETGKQQVESSRLLLYTYQLRSYAGINNKLP